MTSANNGRRLPWHDTARCEASDAQYAGVAAERGVCNGPLPLDRFRLCSGCVQKDNADRQALLFPEVR